MYTLLHNEKEILTSDDISVLEAEREEMRVNGIPGELIIVNEQGEEC